jgi:uncharacterized protein VirK/YbjX
MHFDFDLIVQTVRKFIASQNDPEWMEYDCDLNTTPFAIELEEAVRKICPYLETWVHRAFYRERIEIEIETSAICDEYLVKTQTFEHDGTQYMIRTRW